MLAGAGSGSARAGLASEGAGDFADGPGGRGAPDDAVPLLGGLAAGAGRPSGSVTLRAKGVALPVRPGDAADSAMGAEGGGETGGVGWTGGWRSVAWLAGRPLDMSALEGRTMGGGLGTTGIEDAVPTTAE